MTSGRPLNLAIGAQSWGNESLRWLLQWNATPSLMPIHKYKVSVAIFGDTDGWVFQRITYVSAQMNQFWLNEIRPKTTYFITVRSLVKIDEALFPSENASIVVKLDPPPKKPSQINATELNFKYENFIRNIRVDKLFWMQDSLNARIVWKLWDSIGNETAIDYSITWTPHSACKHYNPAWYVGYIKNVKITEFVIYDLVANCSYFITITAESHGNILYSVNASVPFDQCVYEQRENKKRIYHDLDDFVSDFDHRPIHAGNCSFIAIQP